MAFVHLFEALSMRRRRERHNCKRLIYAVTGPDRRVVYVGATTMTSLQMKLAWIIENPSNNGIREWLYDRRLAGEKPQIFALEHVGDRDWQDAERGWIRWFRDRGELLNVDPGGNCRNARGVPRDGAYDESMMKPLDHCEGFVNGAGPRVGRIAKPKTKKT